MGILNIITDNFNRADNPQTLGTSTTGQIWNDSANGSFTINANRCRGAGGITIAKIDSGKSIMTYQAKVLLVGSDFGFIIRYLNDSNFILFYKTGQIYKRENGSFSVMSAGSMNLSANDIIKIEDTDTQIKCYQNGNLINTLNSNLFQFNTKQGLYTGGSGEFFLDDFKIDIVTVETNSGTCIKSGMPFNRFNRNNFGGVK